MRADAPFARVAIVRAGAPAAVFIGAWTFRFLSTGALENDHFVSLARAHQMLHGAWPVRDFFDPGQPLAYLTSAAAAALGGPSLLTEVVLATTILAMAASLTYVLARRASGSDLIALAAVGVELAAFPRLYNGAKLLIPLVAIWIGWRYADRPSRLRLIALAGWTAVAFLWRHDFAVYIVAPTAVLLFYSAFAFGYGETWRSSLPLVKRRTAEYLVWCVVFLVPWLAYVQWAGGFGSYIASASRFVAVEAQRTGRPDNFMLVLAIVAIPLVAIGLARFEAITTTSNGQLPTPNGQLPTLTLPHIAFAATMAIALDIVFLRDAIAARLADVAGVSVLLVAWLAGRLPKTVIRWAGAGAVLVAALGVVVLLARQGYRVPSPGGVVRRFQMVASNLRDAKPDAIPDKGLLPIVDYLASCTSATERVLVSGFAPQIPVLAHRAFAAGLPAWLPGYYTSASEIDRASAILAREQVSLVVLLEGADVFTRSWPRLAADLRARGFVERTWHVDNREIVVWLPSDRQRDAPSCS